MATTSQNEKEISLYKDIMESFFEKHYPAVQKEKFWKWFILNLTGLDKELDELTTDELSVFLDKLKEMGDRLYDVAFYKNDFK